MVVIVSPFLQEVGSSGGQKGNFVFSELRDCVYKGSQGPAGYFGSRNK